MSDYLPGLSIRLYDILETIGASEELRKLHQKCGITKEIVDTFLERRIHSSFTSVHVIGSSCEGTTTPGLASCVDILVFNDQISVYENCRDAPEGLSFTMLRDKHTYPGYVKVVCLQNAIPQTRFDMNISPPLAVDRAENACFSHISTRENFEKNGPASASSPGFLPVNISFAVKCKKIPSFVIDRLNHQSRSGWSTRYQLNQMINLGCFLLAEGHPDSEESHLEWRLSFSLQERELMFSLNPVQHRCYILLKIIKREFIEKLLGKSISSYHCKTCLFYVIENCDQALWHPDKLLQCLLLCMLVLFNWVKSGYCPNCFIQVENMFDTHNIRNKRQNILTVLRACIDDEFRFLRRIKCDNIGELLMHAELDRHIGVDNAKTNFEYSLLVYLSKIILNFGHIINALVLPNGDEKQSILFLSNILSHLRAMEIAAEPTREAITYLIPIIHSKLAKSLASLAFQEENISNALLAASFGHFCQGFDVDQINTSLVLAAVLYRLEWFEQCLQMLDQIDLNLRPNVITLCACSNIPHVVNHELRKTLDNDRISITTVLMSSVTSCVIFQKSDMEIAPHPLRYEMYRSNDTLPGSRDNTKEYWYDSAVVDAKVFLYLMQYLVFTKLNKNTRKVIAIENLNWIIRTDENLGHLETAYNLLGWVYMRELRTREGLRCFMESWKIKPEHNAAKWHIRQFMDDIYKTLNQRE